MTFDRFGIALALAYGVVVFVSLRFLFNVPVAGAVAVAVVCAVVGAFVGPW